MNVPRVDEWLIAPQKRLHIGGLMVLLAISSFMTPLSLDMYTPAVPFMTDYFDTTADMVNLTLSGFFIFFTLGMLLFGPISDRFGRRPSFIASYAIYAAGSLVCAVAPNIELLILARLFQGLGAGGASSISMAVVKDSFLPQYRGTVLGIMQVLFVIGPVVAPLLGAAIISTLGWRASFWALTIIGIGTLVISFMFAETISAEQRVVGGLDEVVGRFVSVGRNKGFMLLLTAASGIELSFMAYVAVASYIYMGIYGLTEISYSICFSAAALVGVAGPPVFSAISKKTGVRLFTTGALIISVIAGIALLTIGTYGFLPFCLVSMVIPIVQASVRPYTTNILLDQQKGDAGSASALINFVRGVIGSIGMLMPLLPWPDYITALGVTTVVAVCAGLLLWAILVHSRLPLIGIKGEDPVSFW